MAWILANIVVWNGEPKWGADIAQVIVWTIADIVVCKGEPKWGADMHGWTALGTQPPRHGGE
ncbi:hypothetical protein CDL15_Pgr022798 [Punica granatum]|uniref:Uncharacterized protein n=1 Tax=Punica granatum TaxID=22663 RepID=A0A218XEP2_PUNGR|nr:hypothetical protein CDL15_Pgr022798 [Punica granatum]